MLFRLLDALERHKPRAAPAAEPEPRSPESAHGASTRPIDEKMRNEPNGPAPASAMVAPAAAPARASLHPLSLLPLTPELDALLDQNTLEARKAFMQGRKRQIEEFRRQIDDEYTPPRPLPPRGRSGQGGKLTPQGPA